MDHLSDALRQAVADPPPTSINLDHLITKHRRRSRQHWAGTALGAAVLAGTAVVVPTLVLGGAGSGGGLAGAASPSASLPSCIVVDPNVSGSASPSTPPIEASGSPNVSSSASASTPPIEASASVGSINLSPSPGLALTVCMARMLMDAGGALGRWLPASYGPWQFSIDAVGRTGYRVTATSSRPDTPVLELTLSVPGNNDDPTSDCAGQPSGSCQTGAASGTTSSVVTQAGAGGAVTYRVHLVKPGTDIRLQMTNTVPRHGVPVVVAKKPLLSTAQLVAVARDTELILRMYVVLTPYESSLPGVASVVLQRQLGEALERAAQSSPADPVTRLALGDIASSRNTKNGLARYSASLDSTRPGPGKTTITARGSITIDLAFDRSRTSLAQCGDRSWTCVRQPTAQVAYRQTGPDQITVVAQRDDGTSVTVLESAYSGGLPLRLAQLLDLVAEPGVSVTS